MSGVWDLKLPICRNWTTIFIFMIQLVFNNLKLRPVVFSYLRMNTLYLQREPVIFKKDQSVSLACFYSRLKWTNQRRTPERTCLVQEMVTGGVLQINTTHRTFKMLA